MALSSSFWSAGVASAASLEGSTRRQALRVPASTARASSSFKVEDAQAPPNGTALNGTAFKARQLAAKMMAEPEGEAAAPKVDPAEVPHNLATAVVHAGEGLQTGSKAGDTRSLSFVRWGNLDVMYRSQETGLVTAALHGQGHIIPLLDPWVPGDSPGICRHF